MNDCKFCTGPVIPPEYYCPQCGYPHRWPIVNPLRFGDQMSVKAPDTLVAIARDWHGGQWSGLYSVASTGKIFASRATDVEIELRHIARSPDIFNAPPEDIALHLACVEFLADVVGPPE